MRQDIFSLLQANSYPGRGILLGISPDGKNGALAYFIMGRSANSRNRIFEKTEDGLCTKPYDESKMTDPSLIIYHPVRRLKDGKIVVTNGDHTDTIKEQIEAGHCYRHGVLARTFEPDEPHWTPRISGILLPNGSRMLSIIKSLDGDPECCCRYFFEYQNPPAGACHFISTYEKDGSPLPSFSGEPVFSDLTQTGPEQLADALWDALDQNNRVSLYVAWMNLATGNIEDVIRNKNA